MAPRQGAGTDPGSRNRTKLCIMIRNKSQDDDGLAGLRLGVGSVGWAAGGF